MVVFCCRKGEFMDNKFENLRSKFPNFIYRGYDVSYDNEDMVIEYHYEITGLVTFNPVTKIPLKVINLQDKNKKFIDFLVFHIGLIELISYWKCTCSPNVIIEAGYLDKTQIDWFKKLYFYGLGEFFYVNDIATDIDNFMHIKVVGSKPEKFILNYQGQGNLIAIGGGKDSVVTLELLKDLYDDNTTFIINPKAVTLACSKAAGYDEDKTVGVIRQIDKELIRLNQEGYLNGHTPFSSLVAFLSYLVAYLTDKKYIVLSNESSANEPTVLGTKVNHQYSKTYEFENDFNNYTKTYFNIDIKYFSLLRPLNELQIAMFFSKYENYHAIFKSCNVGSKTEPWDWCGNCPKCLFVYTILSPFIDHDKLINIFHEDLFAKENLLTIFLELLGYSETKPFECVGTYSEVRYAVNLTIKKILKQGSSLPFLLNYYYDNYYSEKLESNLLLNYNEENNLDDLFAKIVRRSLNDVSGDYSKVGK